MPGLALENLRFSHGSETLDVENATSLNELEELFQIMNSLFVGTGLRSVADTADSGAGIDARQNPVAAGVDFHGEDFKTGDGDLRRIPVGRGGQDGGKSEGLKQMPSTHGSNCTAP